MNFSRRANHKVPGKKERGEKRREEKKKQKENWVSRNKGWKNEMDTK